MLYSVDFFFEKLIGACRAPHVAETVLFSFYYITFLGLITSEVSVSRMKLNVLQDDRAKPAVFHPEASARASTSVTLCVFFHSGLRQVDVEDVYRTGRKGGVALTHSVASLIIWKFLPLLLRYEHSFFFSLSRIQRFFPFFVKICMYVRRNLQVEWKRVQNKFFFILKLRVADHEI